MQEPVWLEKNVVLAVHNRQLAEHGGGAGIRDIGLLESALTKPINLFHYAESKPDMAALAAAYAFGLIKNHPIVDGNKRTAYIACRLFLKLNGADIKAPPTDKYDMVMKLAAGAISEDAFAAWLRQCMV